MKDFKHIIDFSPIPTFIINRYHKIIYWNTALENLSGIAGQSVVGTDEQWRAFYPQKRPVMADLILDGASDRVLKQYYHYTKSRITPDAYLFDGFFPGLGRNGKWFHITVNRIQNGNHQISAVMTTLQDISEGKNSERKLVESEERYKNLFESAQDSIIVHNQRGKITFANPAASDLTGFSNTELRGRTITDIFPEFKPQMAPAGLPRELHLVRKDSVNLICRVISSLISRDRGPRLVQSIIHDVTEEKRSRDNLQFYLKQVTIAQEEERKRIARDLHDDTLQNLNFLWRSLNNFLLKNPDLPPPDTAFLEQLKVDLDQAAKNVQEFSQSLRLSILDDLGMVPALRHLVKKMNTGGIRTAIFVNGSERRLPAETESMLFRIVQESFTNIRKHACSSAAWLTLDFQPQRLRIIIEDNGRGFKLEERLDEMPRTGKLGLAGIEERVRLLGGSWQISSSEARGTTLTLEIQV